MPKNLPPLGFDGSAHIVEEKYVIFNPPILLPNAVECLLQQQCFKNNCGCSTAPSTGQSVSD